MRAVILQAVTDRPRGGATLPVLEVLARQAGLDPLGGEPIPFDARRWARGDRLAVWGGASWAMAEALTHMVGERRLAYRRVPFEVMRRSVRPFVDLPTMTVATNTQRRRRLAYLPVVVVRGPRWVDGWRR